MLTVRLCVIMCTRAEYENERPGYRERGGFLDHVSCSQGRLTFQRG
jgi:hypothetical protein